MILFAGELQGYAEERDSNLSTFLERPAPGAASMTSRDVIGSTRDAEKGSRDTTKEDTVELRQQLANMGSSK